MYKIKEAPNEVKTAAERLKVMGEQTRIVHHMNVNNDPCSFGKSPACVLIKTHGGVYWYCHRCSCYGFINEGKKSPKEIIAYFNDIKEHKVYKELDKLELPFDCIPLVNKDGRYNTSSKIPNAACRWLWDSGLTLQMIREHQFSWSPHYQRVIIPIYDTALLSPHDGSTQEVIGWIGRYVLKTNEEMKAKKIPKYITRKQRDIKERIYFTVENASNHDVVICEDMLSAIRVHDATGYNTMALLGAHLNRGTMDKLLDYRIILWLDGDMYPPMMKYVQKYCQLGFELSMRYTNKDPKEHTNQDITKILQTGRG